MFASRSTAVKKVVKRVKASPIDSVFAQHQMHWKWPKKPTSPKVERASIDQSVSEDEDEELSSNGDYAFHGESELMFNRPQERGGGGRLDHRAREEFPEPRPRGAHLVREPRRAAERREHVNEQRAHDREVSRRDAAAVVHRRELHHLGVDRVRRVDVCHQAAARGRRASCARRAGLRGGAGRVSTRDLFSMSTNLRPCEALSEKEKSGSSVSCVVMRS